MTREGLLNSLYTYRATVLRVVDGDTIDVRLDLGFHIFRECRVRLLGINAPEKRGDTMVAAVASQARLQALLLGASQVYLRTELDSSDKYGRILGRPWRLVAGDTEGVDVCQTLLDEKLAVEYRP
ncbi:COG1525 Micrococcal nuclease (thermonuclease) homologs [uncultured Caudovirales phage]|uniref:COG1525 Micrococcal nuclease (Thermonuclease) homologs n=1 Tax=uncultured Caudovirales phage TaxID=2100421 RepID=A0A6J5S8C8_9CAUD|nr:COG1525 Micrococcal nuclease (thermonuclease) homologs [uncultured Caudovirales phage]CAB4205119.1 COG1525 Micrococcal nuclease (thermonuclease) homologs [uncultured Caudovirales phage]